MYIITSSAVHGTDMNNIQVTLNEAIVAGDDLREACDFAMEKISNSYGFSDFDILCEKVKVKTEENPRDAILEITANNGCGHIECYMVQWI